MMVRAMGSAQKKPVVWLALLLGYSACAFALDPSLDVSQYAHTAWKVRESLIKGNILSMAQTPDGYLWLATQSGLYRFDGVQPVPWSPPPGEKLPNDFVHRLIVGRDGTLWIGTEKGLASLKNDKLTQYPEVAGRRINPLLRDAEGTIWFGFRDPGTLCAVRATRIQCYGAGSFGGSVSALYQDHKGNLWVSAQTGLWRWAPGTPEHYTFPAGEAQAHALIEDGNFALLMATSKSGPFYGPIKNGFEGLKQLADGKIRSFDLPVIGGHFRPIHLFRSSDGSLWIGTVQGLLHLHQGRIDKFSVNDGLSGDIVTCFFEDREGDVWVGTLGGLDRFREFAVPTISVKQGLSIAPDVLEATPDGSIWVATADGLNRWQNGHVTVYRKRNVADRSGRTNERERMIDTRVTEIGSSGLRDTAYSLGQDDRGRLWAGTREGVFYFDGGRFVPVPGITGGDIFSIAGDRQGNVWISSDASLIDSTPETVVQRIPWDRFGHKHAAVALLTDRVQGGLWLGFPDGGIAYLRDGQVRYSYTVADGLGTGSVMDLQHGSDGAVWASTEGGLSRVKDGRVMTVSSRNGLPCDAVQWAMEDNDRSFWLYMPCGLVRIARTQLEAWMSDSKRSVQTRFFDAADGVWSRGLVRYSRNVAKSPDGKIWFSPPDGVSVIDPQHLPSNKLPPPVYIEHITADGRKFDASRGLRLPARVRDLEINYTALSLAAPEKNRFRYKLEGYDRDWQDAGNRRQAFYSNLSPQNYKFRVMASNDSGVWNQTGDSLEFSIAPAYYQTTWFRTSCVAVFFALLWALYQYRLRQMAREFNAELEGRVDERMRIARELHDTLLQSFHGVLMRFQGARNLLPGRAADAGQVLDNALDDAARAITEARDAVQDLRSSTIVTTDLATAVEALGEELAAHQGATNGNTPAFSVEVEGAPQCLHPILRDEIYRIAGEALRNAFHHARARRIEVEIRYDARQLRVRVRDDGIGIDAGVLSQEGRAGHFGLRGMRERSKGFGVQLEVWSERGSGTEVQLTVPASIAYGTHAGQRFRLSTRKIGTNS